MEEETRDKMAEMDVSDHSVSEADDSLGGRECISTKPLGGRGSSKVSDGKDDRVDHHEAEVSNKQLLDLL